MNYISRAMIDAIYQFDDPAFIKASPTTVIQGWGKFRPIRIRIRILEYSANSNFENDGKTRRIRIPT
jgi:hypothetical protein